MRVFVCICECLYLDMTEIVYEKSSQFVSQPSGG